MIVTVIPIVIRALGPVTKCLIKWREGVEIGGRVETIQTTALLRSARILRSVLETCRKSLANKPRIVPWGKERMPQRIESHSRVTLHRSVHPKREQDQTEKSSYGLDWLQKIIWYVQQSWIINCLKMYKISNEVINFIKKTMKTWRVELTARGRSLVEAKIQIGIFQGDALSPLRFIITMMPLNHILKKCTA